MPKFLRLATAAAIGCFALAACSTPGTPTASETPSTTAVSGTTTPSKQNRYGAPDVTDPIDPGTFLQDPCLLLKPDQVAKLHLGESRHNAQGQNQICAWKSNPDELQSHSIGWLGGSGLGLANLYRLKQDKEPGYWEPTTVSGYPAVFEDVEDRRAKGDCRLTVGVRQELAFSSDVSRIPGGMACEAAKKLALEVIATMKSGG